MPSDVSTTLKSKAKGLLYNFLDSLDKKENDTLKPPTKTEDPIPNLNNLPVSPSQGISSQTPNGFNTPPKPPPKTGNPIPNFNNLSISPSQGTSSQTPNGFVGGFYPGHNAPMSYIPSPKPSPGSSRPSSTPSLARPMAMPVPFSDQLQSLTMQMALRPPDTDFIPQRLHSNPLPPAPIRPSISSTSSTPSKPPKKKPASSPSTPIKGNKGDSPSAPSTPTPKAGQEQCSGVTKAGKRCTRMVKSKAALLAFNSDDGDSSSIPRFCFQHKNELMGPTGYYARKNDEWVDFEVWIPPYLQAETQVSLRVEMEKTRSQSDVEGYIYTFEIREPNQWGKQCGSKEQVLRGFYPGTVEPDEDGNEGSLMKGRVKAGEKGPWCHRLERLIHLELADLVCTAVYLDPSWPSIDSPPSAEGAPNGSKDSNASSPCPDCGSIHKEIFEFKRWKHGKYRGKEWDQLVKPVIDRWGKFVELYV
ncbi:hypothetical protein BJ912DRAFT_1116826 [Pholiota molesta]|nr:hypothetical protein BJ912DRAFT_1116826 [Pholiota molesta]